MFICEIWLFVWYFPQFYKSDMSKYGSLRLRDNNSRLYLDHLEAINTPIGNIRLGPEAIKLFFMKF